MTTSTLMIKRHCSPKCVDCRMPIYYHGIHYDLKKYLPPLVLDFPTAILSNSFIVVKFLSAFCQFLKEYFLLCLSIAVLLSVSCPFVCSVPVTCRKRWPGKVMLAEEVRLILCTIFSNRKYPIILDIWTNKLSLDLNEHLVKIG